MGDTSFSGGSFKVGSYRNYAWYRAPQVWRALFKSYVIVATIAFFAGMYMMWNMQGQPQKCTTAVVKESK